MYEESCSKTLLLSLFIFRTNSSIYNLFFLNLSWKQNYLKPGFTVYKQISFFLNKYIRCYVQWKSDKRFNLFFKLIKNPAVLLIHKFSTEHTELVNQQIKFVKTTIEDLLVVCKGLI